MHLVHCKKSTRQAPDPLDEPEHNAFLLRCTQRMRGNAWQHSAIAIAISRTTKIYKKIVNRLWNAQKHPQNRSFCNSAISALFVSATALLNDPPLLLWLLSGPTINIFGNSVGRKLLKMPLRTLEIKFHWITAKLLDVLVKGLLAHAWPPCGWPEIRK